mgnify:CR=1 FL=1
MNGRRVNKGLVNRCNIVGKGCCEAICDESLRGNARFCDLVTGVAYSVVNGFFGQGFTGQDMR